MKKLPPFILLLFTLFSCNNTNEGSTEGSTETRNTTPTITYAVTNYFPHDTSLFTEGLLIHNGQLFESTGSPKELSQTKSLIGITDLTTGKLDKKVELDKTKYFGEGIVIFNDKIYQLTYKNKTGFIYNATSFKKVGKFSYDNAEGWGLTTNGKELIMSDGTENLTFLHPDNLHPIKTLRVTENGVALNNQLNELEFIKGFIYANLWQTNFIAKIDPVNGKVAGRLDLSSLANEAKNKNPACDVLNGIAYDSIADKIFVTGKFWPNIYQIDFAH